MTFMYTTYHHTPSSSNSSNLQYVETAMISSTTNCHIISLCTFLVCCSARDNITTGEFIIDGLGYLESPGMKFRMGFFPHGNGNTSEVRRYVGIWYTMDPKTVVWVANRDNPVLDSNGFLTVAKDGNFKVLNKDQPAYFNTTIEGAPLTALKLLDTGNVVLINVASGSILWQSFETPTDTLLPGMIMGTNMPLISWKSITDPGSGSFEFQQDQGTAQYSILNGSTKFLWKSGKMSTNSFDENQIFSKAFNLLSNTTTQKRNIVLRNGTRSSETYTVVDPNSSCLRGFEPKSLDDLTIGCKRTSEICEKSTIKDTFINMTMISMDDPTLRFFETNNESECIKECLKDCVCLAYAYSSQDEGGILDPSRKNTQGCWFWDTEPNNLKGKGTHNISFRVSNSDTSKEPSIDTPSEQPKTEGKSSSSKRVLAIYIVASVLVLSLFCSISYISYKRLANRRDKSQNNIEFMSHNTRTHVNELLHLDHSKEEDREGINVPYFELESIIAATDDFSEENQLRQGGFGPVYKGKLPGGQEIAVKSGYMSPEYALDGMFSNKSDVFSFGVLLLEIVSGKRNTGFYQSQKTISLLGHFPSKFVSNELKDMIVEVLVSRDNITTGEFIIDGLGYLESPGMKFRMGFFPHGNANTLEVRRYPHISGDEVLTSLKLLDTGNVVLINVASRYILWQSFETPTDTFLPGMIMGTNMTLTSWKGVTDPGFGSFMFQQEEGTTQYSILNGSTKFLWKSGKMSTNSFGENQIFSKALNLLSNITTQTRNIIILTKRNGTGSWNGTRSSETYTVVDPYSRLVMGHLGKLQYLTWSNVNSQWQWITEWEEPKDDCSSYRVCGPFGMCGRNNDSSCSCLRGFEPKSLDDLTIGCKRTS
ncbi:hypothetical protein L1987_49056 [Smallanthus sonchifolius]|uniref:Uncharacterized protein n=1 Tax=Smallanthus sonchifolius TaxID=185202 RepID=A0ACB9FUP6_9ASTR|nr:hypothetical protein L1987_49056 [Smallanthus sonchifolius]